MLLGTWVLETACAQASEWHRAGYGHLRVAVNLSARQFAQVDLVDVVRKALCESGLMPAHLELELTESLVMTDVHHAIGVLHELRSLGVTLAVDDFGTGYSSLSYLKRLPLDVLKIDRSFVNDISEDSDAAAIARSIIRLGHDLRMQVLAEGVETAEQLAFLLEHGCDSIQGYYFSRPVPGETVLKMLLEGKCLAYFDSRSARRSHHEPDSLGSAQRP
jgi:EAL domain-containing protein (putative c-di-GMP-specific phosphodiesterase class I)